MYLGYTDNLQVFSLFSEKENETPPAVERFLGQRGAESGTLVEKEPPQKAERTRSERARGSERVGGVETIRCWFF